MKKILFVLFASMCILMLNGCDNEQEEVVIDIEICSEYYIASVNHVLENFDEYYGKTIRIEGIFWEHGFDTMYRMVMRQDFSC